MHLHPVKLLLLCRKTSLRRLQMRMLDRSPLQITIASSACPNWTLQHSYFLLLVQYKICIQTHTSVCFKLIQCSVPSSLTHWAQVETRWEGATLRAARGARRRQWRERRGFIALPRRLRAEVYRWTPFRLCYGPDPDPAARTRAARTPCGGSFSQQVGPRRRRDSRR